MKGAWFLVLGVFVLAVSAGNAGAYLVAEADAGYYCTQAQDGSCELWAWGDYNAIAMAEGEKCWMRAGGSIEDAGGFPYSRQDEYGFCGLVSRVDAGDFQAWLYRPNSFREPVVGVWACISAIPNGLGIGCDRDLPNVRNGVDSGTEIVWYDLHLTDLVFKEPPTWWK